MLRWEQRCELLEGSRLPWHPQEPRGAGPCAAAATAFGAMSGTGLWAVLQRGKAQRGAEREINGTETPPTAPRCHWPRA